MKYIDAATIGVDEGNAVLFSDFEHDGPMWADTGPRHKFQDVVFSAPFLSAPSVHISLSMWDVSKESATRLDIQAENISTHGFTIAFRTWGDTKVARVRASWRAIGAVAHPDNWPDF